MNRNSRFNFVKALVLIFVLSSAFIIVNAKDKKPLTVDDVMKFKALFAPTLSDDGKWAAYYTLPDRGDAEATIQSIEKDTSFKVKYGERPQFSKNSQWVVMSVRPKTIETDNAEKDKPKSGMAIVNLANGEVTKFENIKSFKLSEDSKWLAYQIASDAKKDGGKDSPKNRITGGDIVLRQMETGSELNIQNVTEFDFDSLSNNFTYVIAEPTAKKNGIFTLDLKGNAILPKKIISKENSQFSNIKWTTKSGRLVFLSAKEKKDGDPDTTTISVWDDINKEISVVVNKDNTPSGWYIPFKNSVSWTKDGKRLFFGFKPLKDTALKDDKVTFADSTMLDVKTILKKTDLDLWHWNDNRIKTNQKNWWSSNKDSIYRSVYNFDTKKVIQLADEKLVDVQPVDNPNYAIGYDDQPYLKSITWDNDFVDAYAVNLNTGIRKKIATKLAEGVNLSPKGSYAVYYKNKTWFLYKTSADTTIDLTTRVGVPFWDNEFDEPSDPPSYGFGGWLDNEEAAIVYDKYDIWKFYLDNTNIYLNQTAAEGIEHQWTFRMLNLEPEKESYSVGPEYLVSMFNQKTKETGVYIMSFNILGVEEKLHESKKFNVVKRSKNGKFLYSRESYDEFPDLWYSADSTFKTIKKISDVNPNMNDFIMGKAELIQWANFEKDTIQGWYVKPENFDPKKKYPVLVYYYDRFSQTFHNFYQPRMNHRPCYQLYSGDGYIIFVPDIHYHKIGSPGDAAISCVVSGVRKLATLGFIDTTAIAIQGHSWGGYQTAYMITQTPLFAAACAGAPVGNMTSAYSGIRLESGRARQMQYEKQQSRIGGTLWDSLNAYIRNSPIFSANHTKTPFLLMFGDEDNAVPWQQGIELYLAYRRLNKECYMLQYRNEPHIPRKYPNKLDYAIKMKEFFDHYCLKKPAPDWMTTGIEYRGK